MSEGIFTLTFRADVPEPIRPGDELAITGICTVKGLSAEMIDISAYGADETQVALGELKISLFGNKMWVRA